MDTFIASVVSTHGVICSIEFEAADNGTAYREAHVNEVLIERMQKQAKETFSMDDVINHYEWVLD